MSHREKVCAAKDLISEIIIPVIGELHWRGARDRTGYFPTTTFDYSLQRRFAVQIESQCYEVLHQ